MKPTQRHGGLFLLALACTLHAAEPSGLRFYNAWVRATPPNAQVAGAFLTIDNPGPTPDRLLSASTDRAARVEIHEMKMDGDVMQMRRLSDGLAIPAKQRVTLQPGSIHLMLMAPKQTIAEGQSVNITLQFEVAGSRTVTFTARRQAPVDGETEHIH
jgi:copper(I)-binding protein